ncbi:AraC family transcriptional regulator [Gammaproteobacteria bacterium 45_16_T64]|nr:AraC family transcriptional regulator [Gammaproteobacteria bacterium 45_16_T64]
MALAKIIVDRMLELLPEAGAVDTGVPGLVLVRSDQVMTERKPIVYDPSIYIVAQGCKCAHLGDEVFTYDALHYLVLSVPLPLECQVLKASEDEPYLAIKVDIDLRLLNDLIHELPAMEMSREAVAKVGRGIYVSSVDDDIRNTLTRLLACVSSPDKAKVLGPMAVKELLFHVLLGEQGDQLKAFAYRDRHNFQIAEVLNYIQQNYANALEVDGLAQLANMSQSSFHQYFKAVTNVTPIQYIKTMRLHEARRKMLHDNQSASDAAFQVGYASPSQFSREYRRLFGAAPTKDMEMARQAS